MNNPILIELNIIFKEVFENTILQITESTIAKDVPGWDSLSNMLLIAAIEKHFEIKLTFNEVRALKNVGDLVTLIEMKL